LLVIERKYKSRIIVAFTTPIAFLERLTRKCPQDALQGETIYYFKIEAPDFRSTSEGPQKQDI
jgi:hypothetical protein